MSVPGPRIERPDPFVGPEAPRVPLSEAELGALVAAARGRGAIAVRNRALVALLAGSGAKPGEALRLRDEDLDLEALRLVLRSRAGRARTARLLPAARPHVEAWRLVRAHLPLDDAAAGGSGSGTSAAAPGERRAAAPFFCTRAGGAIEPSYLRRLLPRLARGAGLERPVNAGLLRATFAAHVFRLGATLPEVQRLLGHGDARSTLHLVRPVMDEAAVELDVDFRPDRWTLPGTGGDVRVELRVLERATPRPAATPAAEAGETPGELQAAPEPTVPARETVGSTVVRPVRWPEI